MSEKGKFTWKHLFTGIFSGVLIASATLYVYFNNNYQQYENKEYISYLEDRKYLALEQIESQIGSIELKDSVDYKRMQDLYHLKEKYKTNIERHIELSRRENHKLANDVLKEIVGIQFAIQEISGSKDELGYQKAIGSVKMDNLYPGNSKSYDHIPEGVDNKYFSHNKIEIHPVEFDIKSILKKKN